MSNEWISGWRLDKSDDGKLIVSKHREDGRMICGCVVGCESIASSVLHELSTDLLANGLIEDLSVDTGEK